MLSRRTNVQSIFPTPPAWGDTRPGFPAAAAPRPATIAPDVAANLVAGTTLITDPDLRVLREGDETGEFDRFLGLSGDRYFFRSCRFKKEFDALVAEGADRDCGSGRLLSRAFFGDEDHETLIKLRKITSDDGVLIFISFVNIAAFRKFDDILLRELFGLTTAEGRVVTYLYNGISLKEIAERNNASVSTVRDQLSSVFQKTRVNSQPKLVSLLSRLELMLA